MTLAFLLTPRRADLAYSDKRTDWPFVGHASSVTSRTGYALDDLERKVTPFDGASLDRLRLVEVPFVPEVRLHLAEDPIVWWARMEAEAGAGAGAAVLGLRVAGGQAVALYALDHPQAAAGRRVLDPAWRLSPRARRVRRR